MTTAPEWGEIPGWLLAAVVALGVTVAMNYAGRGLAWLLRPVLPRLGGNVESRGRPRRASV